MCLYLIHFVSDIPQLGNRLTNDKQIYLRPHANENQQYTEGNNLVSVNASVVNRYYYSFELKKNIRGKLNLHSRRNRIERCIRKIV